MKKLLGILVLGLLMSGNAYAAKTIITYKNYYDMKVFGVGKNKKYAKSKNMALSSCQINSKKKNLKPEGCLYHDFFRTGPLAKLFRVGDKNQGPLIMWNSSVDKFEKTLKPDEIIQGIKYETRDDRDRKEKIANEKEKKATEKIELAEIIDKAKATCQTLGFEQGTDKFSDCTLKLYSQEIDNKVALEVAKQKSSSSSSNSGTMVIYDPVRDKQNKIDKGMEMITGRCTLGKDC